MQITKTLIFSVLLLGQTAALAASAPPQETIPEPTTIQPYIEQLVAGLLPHAHYAGRELDDDLSAQMLTRYIEMLDGNRIYFLAADIAQFDKQYGQSLDEALKSGDLSPAYTIYRVYRERLENRVTFALRQLETKPDFTVKESLLFDRSKAPWAKDDAQLDDIWRKRVKNDAIGLLLAGKSWEEAHDMLRDRYQNFLRRTEQITSEDIFDTFMNAYALTLDPHTLYMSPRDSEEFEIRMSLSYEGIGAALQTENEYVKIARILPGGAAAKSKALKPDDRVTGVAQGTDGKMVDVIGWRLEDVVDKIRGPKNSVVRLQILPAGAAPGSPTRELALTRSEIQLEEQAAQSKITEVTRNQQQYKLGVIDVPGFYMDFRARMAGEKDYRSTTRDVRKLITELKKQDIDGLVIDLRDNGGGSLSEATELTGLFIDQGPVVQVRNSSGDIDVLEDPDPGMVWDGPLVVLVNRFSASASEIFAGAIQDYGRGLVIGSTTYGKGTVQNLWDLNRYIKTDAALGQVKLTVGKFYRVTGSSTQNRGVQPDIRLPSLIDVTEFGESTEPAALPWDSINPAIPQKELDAVGRVNGATRLIAARHDTRVQQDRGFQLFLQDVSDFKQAREKTSVSLVLSERQAKLKQDEQAHLARVNAWRKLHDLPQLASLEDADNEEDIPEADVLLHETAEILVDFINLKNGTLAPVLAASGDNQPAGD